MRTLDVPREIRHPGRMPRIFISYRRDDAAGFAGRLADALEARFGKGSVFRDVDDIPPGKDFVQALDAELAVTDVFIPLIGPAWLVEPDGRRARLHDPDDYVRREIGMALARDIRIIPALLEGAKMPAAEALPEELAALARRQALMLEDRSWTGDVQRLIAAIEPDPPATIPADAQREPAAADPPARQARRRGLLWSALLGSIGAALGAGWYLSRVPDLSGEWRLDDGSRWRVIQDGAGLEIEEVHHQSREVWRSGTGRITRDGVEVALRYRFHPELALRGTLRLSKDARMLDGELTELPSQRRLALDLQR